MKATDSIVVFASLCCAMWLCTSSDAQNWGRSDASGHSDHNAFVTRPQALGDANSTAPSYSAAPAAPMYGNSSSIRTAPMRSRYDDSSRDQRAEYSGDAVSANHVRMASNFEPDNAAVGSGAQQGTISAGPYGQGELQDTRLPLHSALPANRDSQRFQRDDVNSRSPTTMPRRKRYLPVNGDIGPPITDSGNNSTYHSSSNANAAAPNTPQARVRSVKPQNGDIGFPTAYDHAVTEPKSPFSNYRPPENDPTNGRIERRPIPSNRNIPSGQAGIRNSALDSSEFDRNESTRSSLRVGQHNVEPFSASNRVTDVANGAFETINSGKRATSDRYRDLADQDTDELQRHSNSNFLTVLALFASVALNLYLGWIAWDTYNRYQDLVGDMRFSKPRRSIGPDLDSSYNESNAVDSQSY